MTEPATPSSPAQSAPTTSAQPASLRFLAGAAALGYVVFVGIENMEVLEAPTLGSPIAEIRDAYADDNALAAVTAFCGVLALLFYVVFVAAMVTLLRRLEPRGDAWTLVALVGGIGGPAVAAGAAAATAVLVYTQTAGLSDELTRALFDIHVLAQLIAGVFVAAFQIGIGIAGLRSGVMPRRLAQLAIAIGAPAALLPLAALIADGTLEVVATFVYAGQTLWVFLASAWLLFARGQGLAVQLREGAFTILVIVAGLIGVALLAAPAAAGQFFAWGLEPAPLAALAGGFYVGAAVIYALGVRSAWPQARGLVIAAIVLSVTVFVITLVHTEIFDFDRLQAWAWVVLFAAFSCVTIAILALNRGADARGAGEPCAPWARTLLALLAVLLGILALALWIDPTGLSPPFPFDLPPLGGRFAGSWIALAGVLAGYAALRNRGDEALLPSLAVAALAGGALIAALRTVGDLESGATGASYFVALTLLVLAGLAVTADALAKRRA